MRKGLVGIAVVVSESTEKALKGATFERGVLRRARPAVCSGAAHLKTILSSVEAAVRNTPRIISDLTGNLASPFQSSNT